MDQADLLDGLVEGGAVAEHRRAEAQLDEGRVDRPRADEDRLEVRLLGQEHRRPRMAGAELEQALERLDVHGARVGNVPLGALIPAGSQGLIIAEKGISVSNVVNGTTRLQPCVLLTGQAAGTLAALAVLGKKNIAAVPVRYVQSALLKSGAYIMPYIDVPFNHKQFVAIQKIGATGIMKGKGTPFKWANQTWFYPDSFMTVKELAEGLQPYYKRFAADKICPSAVTGKTLLAVLRLIRPGIDARKYKQSLSSLGIYATDNALKRSDIAILLQMYLRSFDKAIDIRGNIL